MNAQGSTPPGKTYLLAYVSDSDSASAIRALMHRENIGNFAVEPGSIAEATEFLRNHPSPQVLVVTVPSADAAPTLLDALADVVHPATRVIVTGKTDTLSFYNWLIGLGIHDYLLSPFTDAQLATSLDKLKQPEPSARPETKNEKRPTIAVIGARGGVGATTIATSIAALAARDFGLSTALVDTDLHFGTTALSLDLEAGRGLRDAIEKPERIDVLFLERMMLRPFSAFSILASEEPLSESVTPGEDAAGKLLATLAESYALTVLDLPRHLDSFTRQCLSLADTVLIIAEPTIASLRDALRIKDYCETTLKRRSVSVIVNREGLNVKQEVSKHEFSKHLGTEPALHLHYIPEIMPLTAEGALVLDEPKAAPLINALRGYLHTVLGTEAPGHKPGKGIASLFKGKK